MREFLRALVSPREQRRRMPRYDVFYWQGVTPKHILESNYHDWYLRGCRLSARDTESGCGFTLYISNGSNWNKRQFLHGIELNAWFSDFEGKPLETLPQYLRAAQKLVSALEEKGEVGMVEIKANEARVHIELPLFGRDEEKPVAFFDSAEEIVDFIENGLPKAGIEYTGEGFVAYYGGLTMEEIESSNLPKETQGELLPSRTR